MSQKIAPIESLPVSPAQQELWLQSNLGPSANNAYALIVSLDFSGNLSRPALDAAIAGLCLRHKMLGANISEDGTQFLIAEKFIPSVIEHDWCLFPIEEQASLHKDLLVEQNSQTFDLSTDPLIRFHLEILSPNRHRLVIIGHHLIVDGWSLYKLIPQELAALYNSEITGQQHDLAPPGNYLDYLKTAENLLSGTRGEEGRNFWQQVFSTGTQVLDLPTDYSRPPIKTYPARRIDYPLSPELTNCLRQRVEALGLKFFAGLFSLFSITMGRLSEQTDVCIGTPFATQEMMRQANLVNHCVNMLPVRTQFDPEMPTDQLLTEAALSLKQVMKHRQFSIGEIVKLANPPRDSSRTPLYTVIFTLAPNPNSEAIDFSGMGTNFCIEPHCYETLDIYVNCLELSSGGLELQCQYNTDLFDGETIRGYLEAFEAILEGFGKNPQTPFNELPITSKMQQFQQRVEWNNTAVPFPHLNSTCSQFEQQARSTPDRIAVQDVNSQYSYCELDARANQLAHLLRANGVKHGDPVGLCLERNKEIAVVVLAIWKAGAAYVPLDPTYPKDRLAYMVDNSRLPIIITQSSLSNIINEFNTTTLILDQLTEQLAQQPTQSPGINCSPEDLAYVIYTSGSTGRPKGVQIPHRAIVNLVQSICNHFGHRQNDRLLAVTTLSFDLSVADMFTPLLTGANFVVVDRDITTDGQKLIETLERFDITSMTATPSTWRMLIEHNWQGKSNLRAIITGEALPRDLIAPMLPRCQELWNLYGPTEICVWSSGFKVTDPDAPILIGTPIDNTQYYVLDEKLNMLPVGAFGELYIGGAGCGIGYMNQPELTRERFINNSFADPAAPYNNAVLYKTGDVVRLRHNGTVEYQRRRDKQVKLRGFRIELGEIEQALLKHPSIDTAVSIIREDAPGDLRLVAYYVPEELDVLTASELRKHLREILPIYMIPQHFVELRTFPLNSNGKVDSKALPPPDGAINTEQSHAPARTPVEHFLAETWQALINCATPSIRANFFDIGGHSMLVMKSISLIEQRYGIRVTPQDFLMGTLESLAKKIEQSKPDRQQEEATETQAPKKSVAFSQRLKGIFSRT